MDNPEPTARDRAESEEIASQIEIELALLLNIEQGFRVALQWMTRDRGNNRKLSTLRSVARSFERQLTRTRILADQSGYLRLITEAMPQLAEDVQTLRKAREALQTDFETIVLRLEYASPDDAAGFQEVCTDLERYLDRLNVHGQKELEFFRRSSGQDAGRPGGAR